MESPIQAIQPIQSPPPPIGDLKPHYRSGVDDLSRSFFRPCLHACASYSRAVGFFSSSALVTWSHILPELARGNRTVSIRLLASPSLSSDDLDTLRSAATEEDRDRIRREIGDRAVLDSLDFAEHPSDVRLRLRLLAWMIAAGHLEIRFAFPTHAAAAGLFHEKIGVFSFPCDAMVAFTGSANESISGHSLNYETLDVFRGWIDQDRQRVSVKVSQFDEAWSGSAAGLYVVPLSPEALQRVKTIAPDCSPLDSENHADSPPAVSSRWRHQDEAVTQFLRAERGVLEMATGTGKTWTALRIMRELVGRGEVSSIVVAMDGNDLMDQWYKQIVTLSQQLPRPMSVLRHHGPHKEREQFLVDPQDTILIVSRPNLRPALDKLSDAEGRSTLLVHDEVHRLGSPGNKADLKGLSERIRFRLGLSATPEREYDLDGTAFIEEHIGPIIYRFGLEDAIRRGILAPFDYHPIEWRPSQEDRNRIQQVYKRAAAREAAGNPMSQTDIWIELSNVYKTSAVKIPLLRSFLDQHSDLLKRCIIFVATTEYGDRVLELVHRYRHDFHTYFADDESETLRRFARGSLECLITCHRLSEGIDIQSLRTVFLLSSDRARLETIQRIGRCLRIDPANPSKRAQVVDFVRVRDPEDFASDPTSDELRRDWLLQLATVPMEMRQ